MINWEHITYYISDNVSDNGLMFQSNCTFQDVIAYPGWDPDISTTGCFRQCSSAYPKII